MKGRSNVNEPTQPSYPHCVCICPADVEVPPSDFSTPGAVVFIVGTVFYTLAVYRVARWVEANRR